MGTLPNSPGLVEADYRKKVQETLDRIEKCFEDVDPDVAECEQAHGAMTISFADRTRCILSAQPSVRQLWLALASQGTAHHFNYDAVRNAWMDDKNQGIELLTTLEKVVSEKTGQPIRIAGR